MQGIYKIVNIKNNKIYIGQTGNIQVRWKSHIGKLRKNIHENRHLQNAWNKYGENNFDFSIVEQVTNYDLLNEREVFWISFYDSINRKNGYNLKHGGNNGKHLDETKKKIGLKVKGKKYPNRKKIEQSVRLLMSLKRQGKGNSFYGKSHTSETKNKISISKKGQVPWNKGIPQKEETKKKLSDSQKGRVLSTEHKRKVSEGLIGLFKGDKNPIALLNDEKVKIIVKMLQNRKTIQEVADHFNVKPSTIKNIKYGTTWIHITGGPIVVEKRKTGK